MATESNHWLGPTPEYCDVCSDTVPNVFIDGKTTFGPWAIMCEGCHDRNGMLLGKGRGQRYELDLQSGKFMKTGG